MYTFVPNKLFGQLLDISTKNFAFLKTFDLEFLYIKVWFTDQNSKLLEREDKINTSLYLSIKVSKIKNDTLFSSTKRSNVFKIVIGFRIWLKIWVEILLKI